MAKKKIIVCSVALALSCASFLAYNHFSGSSGEAPSKALTSKSSEKVKANEKVDQVAEDKEIVFEEGEHYVSIDPIYGLPDNSVVEVLWYGCPHCYNMEDVVKSDEFKEKSSDWSFEQVHIAKKDGPIGFDFKVYAALKQMGLDATVGKKYMEALHKDGLDRSSFDKFASEHGISVETIKELGENEEADNYFKFISQFSDRDEFKGVPSFVVKGKYIINNRYNIPDVANYLLEKENQSSE